MINVPILSPSFRKSNLLLLFLEYITNINMSVMNIIEMCAILEKQSG